jgi:hypothetical protein
MDRILRNRDELGRALRICALTLVLTMTGKGAMLSAEGELESALHREIVTGDLKGAIEEYKLVLGLARDLKTTKARAVSARALFQMGQCFEKSGRRTEAQAVYTRLISGFPDQTEFSAKARVQMAAWVDALPGPPQLTFALGGPGNVPPGWFLPVLPNDSGCPAGSSCSVVLIPAGAPIRVTGDFMQSFSAAAYRGKTVRLRARLKLDNADSSQLWMSIDRPKGPGERIVDKAVTGGDWTLSTVSSRVDEDATNLNFGIASAGRGRVSVEDVSLEVVTGARQ